MQGVFWWVVGGERVLVMFRFQFEFRVEFCFKFGGRHDHRPEAERSASLRAQLVG